MKPIEFAKMMAYIKAYYPNWNLDVSDKTTLEIWYGEFEDIPVEDMRQVIKDYTSKNNFPPSSPKAIKDVIPVVDDVDVAWEKIMDVYRRAFDNSFLMREIYKEHPSLYPFICKYDFFDVPTDSYGNKCIGYCIGKPFKREYKAYIDSLNVKYIGLAYTSKNAIESQILIDKQEEAK